MSSQTDHYGVLDITPETTPDDIKKAYRQLARETHPDGSKPNPDRFRKVQAAWKVLGDAEAKAQYDRTRAETATRTQTTEGRTGTGASPINDIFASFYADWGMAGQQTTDGSIVIPVNDLALLQGLITANMAKNSGRTGKWEIRKNPKDTRDFVNNTLYIIAIEDGEVHVWRNVRDWMTNREDENLVTKNKQEPWKEGPPKDKNGFFHEYYLSDQHERSLFRNIRIPFSFDEYLSALKSLAGKIANNTRKKHRPDEYDVDTEMQIISRYANGLRFTTAEKAARYPNDEIALHIPPKDFFAELARANELVVEIKPKTPEGQQVSGEKKG